MVMPPHQATSTMAGTYSPPPACIALVRKTHLLRQRVALGGRDRAVRCSAAHKVGGSQRVGEVATKVEVAGLVEHKLQQVWVHLVCGRG